MAIIGGNLGYWLLRRIAPPSAQHSSPGAELGDDGEDRHFGADLAATVRGRTVMDFGCGTGREAVRMAQWGASRVIGVDIQPARLAQARARAERHGVADRCTFAERAPEKVDIIVSKDAFEHFTEPAKVLEEMASHLKAGGCVIATFGPTWLHPRGGHLFSVFPWAHLVFTERALLRWRADFKGDGARRFSEVEGGLNQMTIARFERIVAASPLRCERLDTVPIRGIGLLRRPWLREFGSSIVRCRLVPRGAPSSSAGGG